jgi:hypothetical protein
MSDDKSTTAPASDKPILRDRMGRPMKHGMYRAPEYRAWQKLRDRCYNPRSQRYGRYGARGIKVCDSWRDSFENFYQDMGPRPSKAHSIERINNDGDYSPHNCKWATRTEQNRNRSDNIMLEYGGESMTMTEWSRRFGIGAKTLELRLKAGWTTEKALTTPVAARRWRCKPGKKAQAQPPREGEQRYLGVTWTKIHWCWTAHVDIKGSRRSYVGQFNDSLTAAIARDEAAVRILGAAARLNFTEAERQRLKRDMQNQARENRV